jgi:hypothetical protein
MEQIMTCNDIETADFTLRQDDVVQILTRNVEGKMQNEIKWASENARIEKSLKEYESKHVSKYVSKSQKALHKNAKKIKSAPRHEIRPDGAYKLCIYLADYFGDTEPE